MGHTTQEELIEKVQSIKEKVEVGGKYYHYKTKDHFYTVLNVGLLEASEEPCVVYQTSLPSQLIWVRSMSDWLAEVETEKGMVLRFQKVI